MGLIGTDVNSGVARFSFDIPELTDGVGFVVVAMGVFGYGEIISNLSQPEDEREVVTAKVEGLFPTKEDFKNMMPAVLRGTALGSLLGVLPGGGALLAAFAAYTIEKKTSLRPGEVPFGQGNIRGVAAPEAANNAGAQTSFIPLLTLGIPTQRRDGFDGGCDDHSQHSTRPTGDDQQPRVVLGSDCLDVDW
jgi:TctA family transporter